MPLLDVKSLSIGFGKAPPVVCDVSFSVERGETLSLVGESGSGKTLTCRSILRILPASAQLRGGEINYNHGGHTHSMRTAPPCRDAAPARGSHFNEFPRANALALAAAPVGQSGG